MRTLLPNDKLKDPEPEDKTNLAKGAQKKAKSNRCIKSSY